MTACREKRPGTARKCILLFSSSSCSFFLFIVGLALWWCSTVRRDVCPNKTSPFGAPAAAAAAAAATVVGVGAAAAAWPSIKAVAGEREDATNVI